jgi:hypothetical protein
MLELTRRSRRCILLGFFVGALHFVLLAVADSILLLVISRVPTLLMHVMQCSQVSAAVKPCMGVCAHTRCVVQAIVSVVTDEVGGNPECV